MEYTTSSSYGPLHLNITKLGRLRALDALLVEQLIAKFETRFRIFARLRDGVDQLGVHVHRDEVGGLSL